MLTSIKLQHIEGYIYIYMYINSQAISSGNRGSDRMVFGFTSTYATGAVYMYLSYECLILLSKSAGSNPAFGEVYLIQHYMIKFMSGLW
jgi:hypothetical protein